jgi:polyisoprenoid-binding protein YceI
VKQILQTALAAWSLVAYTSAYGAENRHPFTASADSRLELVVEKTGLYSGKKHVFTFERYGGAITLDPETPERSKVDLTIESNSIVCHDTWVSPKDLRKIMEEATKNMLAADRYATLSFQSTSVTASSPGKYLVQGMLTIRGTAKPAKVLVSWTPGDEAPLLFLGEAVIKLTDYGLKPPTAVLGAIGTKDEMQFRFRLAVN